MKQGLKILFLASWYPSRRDINLGNFVWRHAEAISRNNSICVVHATSSSRFSIEVTEKRNVTEIIIYFVKRVPLLSYWLAMRAGMKVAREQHGNFDLAHVHVAFPAGILALGLKIPYIITEHFSGFHPISGFQWPWMQKVITRIILRRAKKVVPVSKFLRNAMKAMQPKADYTIIPNVVNGNLFNYEPPPKNKVLHFLHISSLEEKSKNISGLLKGVSILKERGVEFMVNIGGDGNILQLEVEILMNRIPLDHIQVFINQPIEKVAELMKQNNCLLMFSHFETQSCTVLESLCSGRPVVSSSVGGIPEIVDETNSILVEPDNPEDLADKMEEMIRRYGEFDLPEISKKALAKYSYDKVANDYQQVYINALT